MPDWIRYLAISFGVLFFISHVAWMLYSFSFASDRAKRREYFGIIVPGFAGVCIAGAAWLQPPLFSVILGLLGGLLLLFGRAAYEILVFRGDADS